MWPLFSIGVLCMIGAAVSAIAFLIARLFWNARSARLEVLRFIYRGSGRWSRCRGIGIYIDSGSRRNEATRASRPTSDLRNEVEQERP